MLSRAQAEAMFHAVPYSAGSSARSHALVQQVQELSASQRVKEEDQLAKNSRNSSDHHPPMA